MVTIKDIARETGLGLATISKYLNGGTVREKNRILIEEAIDRMGYTVNEFARGLKTSRSKSIGVIIPDLKNIFITNIISTAEDILRKQGYSTLVCDCQENRAQEAEVVRFLMSKRVDGIINMPIAHDGSHLGPAIAREIPIVLIDRLIDPMNDHVSAVLVDNIGGAFQAVSTMIEAGHRSIGVILGPKDIFTTSQRQVGYAQAMLHYGLLPNDRHVIYSDYTIQGGYDSICRLLQAGEITAVFVSNYYMTLGAMMAINEQGVKIPEQLSLIGFDDQHLAQVIRPRLTIVTQPLDEIGSAAADILLEKLAAPKKEAKSRIVTLPTGMVQGASIKKI